MEKSEKGYVLPTSDIDRGLQLDDRWPALAQFLSVDLLEGDEQSAVELFRSWSSIEKVRKLVAEIHSVLSEDVFPLEEIEDELARYFAGESEARVWLCLLADCLMGKTLCWPNLTQPDRTRPDPVAIELERKFPAAWQFFVTSYSEGQNDEQAVSSVLKSWSSSQLDLLQQELLVLASQDDVRIDKIEDFSDLFFESKQDFRSWAKQIVRLLAEDCNG